MTSSTAIQIDQSQNPNFVKVQAAGRAGLLDGIKGLENFGQDPKEDTQQLAAAHGLRLRPARRRHGRHPRRLGHLPGRGYTNSNVLFPAIDATGIGSGVGLQRRQRRRHPQPGRQLLSGRASRSRTSPARTRRIRTRCRSSGSGSIRASQMPYTRQTAFGWSHQLSRSTVFDVDFVRNDGRDLNVRPRINTRPVGQPTAPRRLAFLDLQPNAVGTRPAVSRGQERIHGAHHGLQAPHVERVRLHGQLHAGGGEEHDRHGGRRAQREQPAGSRAALRRPAGLRSDEPHRRAAHGLGRAWSGRCHGASRVAPIFLFRSALPVSITEGIDLNGNGENNDLPAQGLCVRRRRQRAEGDRRLRDVELRPRRRALADEPARREVVPAARDDAHRSDRRDLQPVQREQPGRVHGHAGCWAPELPNPDFLQPTEYSGDFQNPEQRVGQIGFRFTF